MKSDWAFIKLKIFFKAQLHQARTYLGQQVLFHTSSFLMFYLAMTFFLRNAGVLAEQPDFASVNWYFQVMVLVVLFFPI